MTPEFLPDEAEAELLNYSPEMSEADYSAALNAQAAEVDAQNEFQDPYDCQKLSAMK
jgi:hypothetical protein